MLEWRDHRKDQTNIGDQADDGNLDRGFRILASKETRHEHLDQHIGRQTECIGRKSCTRGMTFSFAERTTLNENSYDRQA